MYDPDFVILIGGEDVTSEVMNWKLHHVDEGISNIVVTLSNHDHLLSGLFSHSDELSLVFGYQGNLGEKIEMTVTGVDESYRMGMPTIKITAKDDCCEMNVKTVKGHFKEGIKPTEVAKRLAADAGPGGKKLTLHIPGGQDPELSSHVRMPLPGTMSVGVMLSHLGNMMYFPGQYDLG